MDGGSTSTAEAADDRHGSWVVSTTSPHMEALRYTVGELSSRPSSENPT
jgi:hypothetical protein